MKLYTRTGDSGTTSLIGGHRISKDSPRLEAYGTLDELNSHIGLVAASCPWPKEIASLLTSIQMQLFDIGTTLATHPDHNPPVAVDESHIRTLEQAIDNVDSRLPALRSFILPGGCIASAHTHVARTVCRRAERRIIALEEESEAMHLILQYINRLSDLLFALARYANIIQCADEKIWIKNS